MKRSLFPLTMLAVAMTLTFAPPATHAGRIDAGTIESGVALLLDFDGPDGSSLVGELLGGYFVVDGVLTGGRLNFATSDDWSAAGFHLFLEQHFETDTPWIPYVGASLGFEYCSYDYTEDAGALSETEDDAKFSESESALVLGLTAGVKFYITETTALDFAFDIDMASEDVYHASGGKGDNVDVTLTIGFRFFLF